MPKKIMFVFGTRPEAIKMSPLIRLAKVDPHWQPIICSTGQHREMLHSIFKLFEIQPDYDFGLMKPGQTLKDITVGVLEQLTPIVRELKPDWIVVQGDTTTAMAASLCGFYERVPVAHVEAGLRTHDIHSPFPEEFNRRVTALIAEWHFAPTDMAAQNLLDERVPQEQILITGNTGIDALMHVSAQLESQPDLVAQYASRFPYLDSAKKLILVTLHRRESFGPPMRSVMKGLLKLARRDDVELLIPLHPNPQVREAASDVFGEQAQWAGAESLLGASRIWLVGPQDYLDFVYLMRTSHFIISDSGGVQEEAPGLAKPVLVVRENTERPEAVRAGTSRLIGTASEDVYRHAVQLLDDPGEYLKMARAHNPFGDGNASRRILDALLKEHP